jgi:hypothetical protein
MLPAVRWLLVAVVALGVASPPTLLRLWPAHESGITAADLAARIDRSARMGWSGEVRSTGSLEVPLTGSTFGGVARLLGEQSDLRVWWRDPEHYRVDRIRTSGEQDLVRDGVSTVRWSYESGTATFTPYSPVRLPDDADVVPSALAARLLAGARPGELSRLPSRRVAGRDAAGLRLVSADPRSTLSRVEVWADQATGLPLRVDVYAGAKAPRPILTTELITVDLDEPATSTTSYSLAPGVKLRRSAALDEAAGANAFAPFELPDKIAGLPRRGRPEEFRAVGVYGRGPVAVLGVPLRGFVARGLRDQLRRSAASREAGNTIALEVGPLSVLLVYADRGGLLLAGTVTPTTLETAARDLVAGLVRTR